VHQAGLNNRPFVCLGFLFSLSMTNFSAKITERMPSIKNNPNLLVQYLQKPASEFTKEDIVRYIEERDIEMLNFRYVAEDGKLKTINFMITGPDELDMVLSSGERVDGSSIFSYLDAESSDLYLVPRYRTAFLNPFSPMPSVDILCSFYTENGQPLESSPENILRKALSKFSKETGMELKMMGELEFYVAAPAENCHGFLGKGYHSGEPFTLHEKLRAEAIKLIARCGGAVRFGHAEKGRFSQYEKYFEQHEIEFSPVDPETASDQIVIAKWILRMLGAKHKVNVTFIPKLSLDQPGSSMHIHFLVEKAGKNKLTENGGLSDTSLKMIAGLLDLAPAITAFSNTIPISYLRTIPGQQAPHHISWGKRNRSTLVRVPLGWNNNLQLGALANQQEQKKADFSFRQTIEYRGSDGSANPYLLMAALVVGFMKGLADAEAIKKSEAYFCSANLFSADEEGKATAYKQIPKSCEGAAAMLEEYRHFFEAGQIFPKSIIDYSIRQLKSFNDKAVGAGFKKYENDEMPALIDEYLHYM
jgi:glutamine synthetase